MTSELDSDLEGTVDWGRKWSVDLNAGKTQLVSLDQSNSGAIDVKMDGSVLQEKSFFKILGLTFSSKLDCASYIISIAKAAFMKIGALICSMKSLSPGLLHIPINLTYSHTWNTVVMSGLGLLFATCWISYKYRYARLFIFLVLPLWYLWLIVKM